MSTAPHEADPATAKPLEKLLLLDYPEADIIIRSYDHYQFRVLKTSIAINSPILSELIRKSSDSPGNVNADASLPVVQLPEKGEILYCLLTFIFPEPPQVPPTAENFMELLSIAQKYQMGTILIHIRGSIARQNSLPTRLGPALHTYALAQKYRLLPEALQTARTILTYPMTIENFDNKLDIMPGACLHELWKYHERVRVMLESDLTEFRMSRARGTITDLCCTRISSSSQIPSWLDIYIESIGKSPHLFDFAELNIAMARHTKTNQSDCECASIPSQTIRDFWEALASVVHGCFEKAETALSLVRDQEDSQVQINLTPSQPVYDVSDTNLILRSSDLVDFRVHKSVLATVSPFFKDLLSLPQPSDSEIVDGLPVVQLPEAAELLNSFVSILYHVRRTVIPDSYEKVLYLLAACQKYEMTSIQSSIRAKVKIGEFPAPKGAEVFSAYAIASGKGLISEMENAARQTLDLPMTFEILGEGLRLFDGWALRDLANFRKRCRDSLVPCLDPFFEVQPTEPSSIWLGCPEVMPRSTSPGWELYPQNEYQQNPVLPRWLTRLFSRNQHELRVQKFTHPLDIHSRIRGEYIAALQNHGNCYFCLEVHMKSGLTFCMELENKLMEARDKESVGPLNEADI